MLEITFIYDNEQFRFGLLSEDSIYKQMLFKNNFYESDLLEFIKTNAKKGGMYFDLGACYGTHAVFFGRFLADYVIAIEPIIPDIIEHNILQNRCGNILILPYAVSDKESKAEVVIDKDNIGRSVIRENSDGNVLIYTLDEIYDKFGKGLEVNFIKIDVEGYEYRCLLGAERIIDRFSPDLSVEAESKYSEQYMEAERWLLDREYKVKGKFCQTPTFYFSKK